MAVPSPAKTSEIQIVSIDSLLPGNSPRLCGEDEEHARRLAETDTTLPPILVHRGTRKIIDGMHRLRAAQINGQREINVKFFEGSEEEAFLRAVEENVKHGLPLSTDDRKAAAMRIIDVYPGLSDRAIASCTALSAKTVGALRRRSTEEPPRSNVRIGADGRSRPLNAAAGRRRAAELITARPDTPVRDIAKVAGVSVGTAHDVQKRVRRGDDPVPAGNRRDGMHGDETASSPSASSQPALPSARAVGKPMGHGGGQNSFALLQRLKNDPALRHTDPGRKLIRLLAAHMGGTDRPDMIEAIPPHCLPIVAELARRCADSWSRLARELERRKNHF